MSRFFTGGSSSDDESDSGSDSGSDERETKPSASKVPSRFARDSSSDSDEGSGKKRVVRSAKDKAIEDFRSLINTVNNHIRINDWNAITDDFDNLNKLLSKSQRVLNPEGNRTPRIYIRALVILEDFIKETQDNKDKVKLNTLNARSFNAMKQNLKKHNKKYEKELEDYRKAPDSADVDEKPVASDSDEDEKSESEDEAKEPSDSEKDSDSGGESDGSSVGSYKEEEEDKGPSRWMLKADTKDKKPAEKKDKKEKEKTVRVTTKKVKTDEEGKAEKKAVELNQEDVKKKIKEILVSRGKRNTDPVKQMEQLKELLPHAKDPELQIEVLTHVVSAHFDTNRSIATHLSVPNWRSTVDFLTQIIQVLENNPSVLLHEADEPEPVAEQSALGLNDEELEGSEEKANVPVQANLMAFVERLDDEYTKSLQAIDPHTSDYLQRVGDEPLFLELAERIQNYYDSAGKPKRVARIAARRVEHIYYKLERDPTEKKPAAAAADADAPASVASTDAELAAPADNAAAVPAPTPVASDNAEIPAATPSKVKIDSKAVMDRLTSVIYAHGDERLKTRSMLCHIYYHALHERFYQARDMMLMSHLQDSIHHMDIPTQILFNRTMAQLGLCAFRDGLIREAHNCLAELYAGGRVKELLGQGITNQRYGEKNPEQEKQERRRQYPYHMHINQEMLEAVHLISAMLLEVPNMALNAVDSRKKVISKTFRRWLDFYDRQVFNGPPENTREAVIAASKALNKGDWKKSIELLAKLQMWVHLHNADNVKNMLKRKLQEEALRTYLFTYSASYDSISIEQLTRLFELPVNTVHSIVSSMMISEELHASWDQPTNSIIMHRVEPTHLQFLALQFAEKAALLVENNERLMEMRSGNYGYRFDAKNQQQREREGGRGGYQGRGGFQGGRGRGGYPGGYQQREGGFQQREGGYQQGGRGGYQGRGGFQQRGQSQRAF
eukprot:TRINITY_DN1543_c0_g1_i2.p1 TRINITY_DN1543_c0_g1~~TRINITY_DN1543_c0_g1_i2.p1  ORF type:complete len:954 (+),score=408.35 TRINITY_DN1543_c0_g1_i2:149-3010(+)